MPQDPPPKPRAHPAARAAPTPRRRTPSARSARGEGGYAELQVTSNFTFLTGASHPDEYAHRAAELGLHAVAITDRNTLAGVVRAHVAAKQAGVPLVVGCRLELAEPFPLSILVYPGDRDAYAALCRLLTLGKRRAPKGQCRLALHDLLESAASNTRGRSLLAAVIPPKNLDDTFIETLRGLRAVFDDDRLSLAASCLYTQSAHQRLDQLAALAHHARVPLLATNDAHYHARERRPLQDVLTCIRHAMTIDRAAPRLHPNAERHLKPPAEMHRLFSRFPGALARGIEIAERASAFSLDQLRYEYPDEVVPPGETPISHLTNLTRAGAASRYPAGVPDKVNALLTHELRLIEELGYARYFLTVEDIVRFARSRGILCQGRGAAANSAVCYCLGVTSVDPDRVSMLFERFVSRERDEPPDIDIDFEHERREEVIQYLYEKYGRDRAALVAEVITYRGRSAVRDVGKAMGLPLDCVGALAREIDWWSAGPADAARVREIGLNPEEPRIARTLSLAGELIGFPRHLSQHVGGFVIARSPLSELVPIENAAMENRTVIEWDKDDVDAMAMLKVDCLGLGMLTCLRKALGLVNGEHGAQVRRCGGAEGEERGNVDAPSARRSEPTRSVRVSQPLTTGGTSRDTSEAHPSAADRRRFTRRTEHSTSDRRGTRHDQTTSTDDSRDGGTRPDAQRPDPQPAPRDMATHNADSRSIPPHLVAPPRPLALHTIPPEDPATYDMICAADTVGVFQIESRAQMSMLPRLRPRCYYDLVIEVAIVRPGPIQGKMVHPYLQRRASGTPVQYASPEIERVLGRTLGVPLFQEQAMSLAVVAAGFTPGEADQLRRAMAAWKRSGKAILRFERKLIDGMLARGYSHQFAQQVFQQITGFSGYGFPESHAASFAHLVYASAYLKRHHPAAFAAALINSQPMGFYQPAQIVRDAQAHGVEVRPIDIHHSQWDCTLEPAENNAQPAVRLGLRMVRGLPQRDAEQLIDAVKQHAPFHSIERLWRLSTVPVHALRTLAHADAFGSMGLTRQQALWRITALRDADTPLFDTLLEHNASAPPRAAPSAEGDAPLPHIPRVHQVSHDYHAVGVSLKAHPISFARQDLRRAGVRENADLADPERCPAGTRVKVAGIVLVRQRPGTASGILFMTLEDETGIANLIVRPRVFERYRRAARHAHAVVAEGAVERQGSVVHVMTRRLRALDHTHADVPAMSRDFH